MTGGRVACISEDGALSISTIPALCLRQETVAATRYRNFKTGLIVTKNNRGILNSVITKHYLHIKSISLPV
jgi:hypothetical protein